MTVFEQDIEVHGGYIYTTNGRISSQFANERLTRATYQMLNGEARILDFGCGDGTYTRELSKRIPYVYGWDIHENVRKSDGYFLLKNYNQITSLAPFDAIVIRGVLHHCAYPSSVLPSVKTLSRTIIILEPNGNNIILKLIEKLSTYHRDHGERSFRPQTIRRWCKESGYRIVKERYVGFVPFFCPDWMARIMNKWTPKLEQIPVIRELFSAVFVVRGEKC